MAETPRDTGSTGTRTWLDRAIGAVAPRWQLSRLKARLASDLVLRHYEAASVGRRTNWARPVSDPSSATAPYSGRLRDVARDLVRNNPYAQAALSTIVDHTVGWGIQAKPRTNAAVATWWKAWANTTACDADGRTDFAGLQKAIMRTVVESGEVLVRRRTRRISDGFPIPMQLQVLEPDYLDTSKHGINLADGGRIVYGVEYDPIGNRRAYWLFQEHPGNSAWPTSMSRPIPASGVLHIFRNDRPGGARGASWFAPVLLRFKDFDEYEDATLLKQKIAACLAVITTDVDGTAAGLGTVDDTRTPAIDSLEPGAILNVPPGRTIEVVQPPAVTDHQSFCNVSLRAIASGIGVTYEDMTGDYTNLPFSAARMSRIRHWAHVSDWQGRLMIPQFCDPVWQWANQIAAVMNLPTDTQVTWTPPPIPMIEPDKEGLAYQRNIRNGIQSWSDAVRERGYDPGDLLDELEEDFKEFDRRKLMVDCDPRYLTQAGQLQGNGVPKKDVTSPKPVNGAAA